MRRQIMWTRRLPSRALPSDDVAERGVGGEPRGLSRASDCVACVGRGEPTARANEARGDAPVDHRRRHVSPPTLPNFEKKISVVYQ